MCGIAGYVGSWTADDLGRMRELLYHRGPDESSVHLEEEGRLGFAHTRLSIIDVSGGQQPLMNEDRTVQVIFNGEIYNHRELGRELEAKGHRLATGSDGEVIAHLFEEEGAAFIDRLRGMYSIAVWDRAEQALHLFRDRFGIKPLYYTVTDRGLLFASEIKANNAFHRVREVDPQALDWYLAFRYVPEDRTMFAGIRKLLPAHRLCYRNGRLETHRYWDIRDVEIDESLDEGQCVEELEARLRESIDLRLMSEVPLGAFLSGGHDSSFIVGLTSGLVDHPVETFSFGVGTGWYDESEYAALAAETFSTSHHPLRGACDRPGLLREIAWFLDEPLGDAAILPTYELSRLTRDHVTVVLTGEGADELLGGYDKYKVIARADRAGRYLPGSPFALLASALPVSSKWRRASRFMATASNRARAYMELIAVFSDAEKRRLLCADLREELSDQEPAENVIRRILDGCRGDDYISHLMHIDVHTWLVNDVLLKADKMTMAHALEGRVPFLDHEFAEFCASVPGRLRMKGWREKHLLREAMSGFVPDEIVNRRKHGFTVPMEPWVSGDADGPIRSFLSESRVAERGWFEAAAVGRLLRSDLRSEFMRRQVFALLALEAWAQVYLDPPRLEPPERAPIGRTVHA